MPKHFCQKSRLKRRSLSTKQPEPILAQGLSLYWVKVGAKEIHFFLRITSIFCIIPVGRKELVSLFGERQWRGS
jgi:hypothetical protein